MGIHSKEEIITALNEQVTAFTDYINTCTRDRFEAQPRSKWSSGQNLDHLIRAIKPLQAAYSLPKFFLRLFFGKSNRPSRPYDELVAKYKAKLAAGGKASGRYIPPIVLFEQKMNLIRKYTMQKEKLIEKIKRQKEGDLDAFILPHPLLGKVTMREMLFFTIYHNEHHLELLKARMQWDTKSPMERSER